MDYSSLSPREYEVLGLIGHGYGRADMARLLGVSASTIDAHQLHIIDKLGFPSMRSLRLFAIDSEASI